MKPRLLVISERYSPENFLVNDLVAAWVKRGYRVSVLTQVPSYPADRPFKGYPNRHSLRLEDGVRVRRFRTVFGYKKSLARKILNYAAFMLRASWYGLFEIPRHDAVFVYHTGPLTQAMPLAMAKSLFHRRTVIWTQDVWPDTVFAYGFPSRGAFAVVLKAFVRFIYGSCDRVCVSSEGFVRRVKPHMGRGEAVFVPQWVPDSFLSALPAPFDFPPGPTRFIFTGNIGTMQNLETVVRAFSRFGPEKAHLYVLGDGSRRGAAESLARELGCQNVSFLGSVTSDRVLACIRACDYALLSLVDDPIINLTVPAKFQSYLAAGRPILAACKGEARAMVEDEALGYGADPDDPEGIAAAIGRCLGTSPARYEEFGRNMGALLAARYRKDAILDMFDSALGGARG